MVPQEPGRIVTSREQILSLLRAISFPPYEMPEIGVAGRPDDLLAAFETGLQSVAGQAKHIRTLSDIQVNLDERIARGEQVLSMVTGLTGNRSLDPDPHLLNDVDFALFCAQWGVAENGAVWVSDHSTGHRIAPFITEHLGVVLRRDHIVSNLHQAIERIRLEPGHMGVFIAGPSKTADIEQALVIGAHGACSLTVYLY
jgi:L-lactate dehydrogenase complex protein LldG